MCESGIEGDMGAFLGWMMKNRISLDVNAVVGFNNGDGMWDVHVDPGSRDLNILLHSSCGGIEAI